MFSNSKESLVHSDISARNIVRCENFDANEWRALRKIGVNFRDEHVLAQMMRARQSFAMDAIQPTVTTGSIGTPVQFLQNWLPGFVSVITAARNADEFLGIMTTGSWEDEQIVQGVLERTGTSLPYGDYTNVPIASWNVNFVARTVVRFEEGMRVGNLDAARASRMQVDDSGRRRESAALSLEIIRNTVGFSGYNSGNNFTYGFLNDPNLPSYLTVANGASASPLWSTKSFLEIQKDILTAIVTLRTQSQDTVNPNSTPLTLGIATAAVDRLAETTNFGISVRAWLKEAYPNIRVVSAPQLNAANGGANVFYLYADKIQDLSSDDGRVWIQAVPTKFQIMGVQQLAKGYEEDYSNATAGAMLKRPFAVVRFSGI